MKTKKIIKVLKFMKNYCSNRTGCDCLNNCRFSNKNGECLLDNVPEEWIIDNIKMNLKAIEEIEND